MALFSEQTHDRLGITLIIAFALHAIVIFTIKFDDIFKQTPVNTTHLEITLSKRDMEKEPENADYIAQTNQEGGGESDKKDRPTDDNTAITPDISTGQAPFQSAPTPTESSPQENRLIQAKGDDPSQFNKPQDEVEQTDPVPPAEIEYDQMDTAYQETHNKKPIEAYSLKNSRVKTIDASTKKATYAKYYNYWIEEVKQISKLNFPNNAKRTKGSVTVVALVKFDGSLLDVYVYGSSGKKILDDTALLFVRMAAPFKPFPPEMREEMEIMTVKREFVFNDELNIE